MACWAGSLPCLLSRRGKRCLLIPLSRMSSPSVAANRNFSQLLKGARICRTLSTAASSDLDESQKVMADSLETYSRFQPCPVSIAHFLEFGRAKNIESSFLFLRREVPVRIGNIMKELQLMPKELTGTRGCSLVKDQYAQSFKELIAYDRLSSKDDAVLRDFTSSLLTVRERHADTVVAMAEAVMEFKVKQTAGGGDGGHQGQSRFEKNIQYFLDRLYTSRISTRMLINQHTMLFDEDDSGSDPICNKVSEPTKEKRIVGGRGLSMVGTIDPNCEVVPIVEQAYSNARFLCEQYYMSAPEMVFSAYDGSKRPPSGVPGGGVPKMGRKDVVTFVYVPSHLYHIIFELFKNAMRATIENAGEEAVTYEPIRVCVVKGKEDLTIKISDRGSGIPRSLRSRIFEYLYTTAPNPILTNSSDISEISSLISGGAGAGGAYGSNVPLAGLGYGLPLSRLYARYFAGDLELYSIEGWGTDAVIYLQALAGEAKERLPIYHEVGSRKIYEAQLTASDWTMSNEREIEARKPKAVGEDKSSDP